MRLVPLMHQILWLTSETSMKIALFSNFECHRVPAWVRYPPQPITCCARDRNYTWYKYTLLYLLCKYTVSIIFLPHFLFSVPWICFTCIQFHSVLRIIRIHIFLSDISHLFHLIRRISFLPSFRMSKQNQFQNIHPHCSNSRSLYTPFSSCLLPFQYKRDRAIKFP